MVTPFMLDTARLSLRRIDAGHLDDLVELDSDPEVMRYINGGTATPRRVYADTLLARMMAHADQPYGFSAATAWTPAPCPRTKRASP